MQNWYIISSLFPSRFLSLYLFYLSFISLLSLLTFLPLSFPPVLALSPALTLPTYLFAPCSSTCAHVSVSVVRALHIQTMLSSFTTIISIYGSRWEVKRTLAVLAYLAKERLPCSQQTAKMAPFSPRRCAERSSQQRCDSASHTRRLRS